MKSWLRARRFFIKVLFLTISILLIVCILFSGLLYSRANNSVKESILLSEQKQNTDLLNQANIYFKQLVSIGYTFSNLDVPFDKLSLSENYWTRTTFNNTIQSHVSANQHISNIDIRFGDQSMFPSQISHESLLGTFSIYQIYTEETVKWPYEFDISSLGSPQHNQITITLRAFDFSKQIFTSKEKERLDYLLTSDHIVLLSNQSSSLFQSIENILPSIDITSAEAISSQLLTYGDYYYILSGRDQYGFRVLSLVPISHYSSQYSGLQTQTLIMSGCLFLFALLVSVFLTLRFYRPIKQTVDLLLTYIPNELPNYENEISFIHDSIAKYIPREAHLESVVPHTLSRIQNAQIAVQQHQINSHFLFNTLENIKAISIRENGINNKIETSIILLNSIIREGIYQKNIFVPLAQEIHLLNCYLALMQLRYPDISVLWSIDEATSQCRVFKFTLQPILENCFAHAFQHVVGRPKNIIVTTELSENDLLITIQDNGFGIDHDSLQRIKESLSVPISDHESQHVGIYNVHKRITEAFGPHYGITLSSSSSGTVVEIRYPVIS